MQERKAEREGEEEERPNGGLLPPADRPPAHEVPHGNGRREEARGPERRIELERPHERRRPQGVPDRGRPEAAERKDGADGIRQHAERCRRRDPEGGHSGRPLGETREPPPVPAGADHAERENRRAEEEPLGVMRRDEGGRSAKRREVGFPAASEEGQRGEETHEDRGVVPELDSVRDEGVREEREADGASGPARRRARAVRGPREHPEDGDPRDEPKDEKQRPGVRDRRVPPRPPRASRASRREATPGCAP